MAQYVGVDATVKKGTFEVAEMASWSLDMSAETLAGNIFGSDWAKNHAGLRSWSMSVSGFFDPSDTNGQKTVETAFFANSKVTDLNLYVDSSSYWTPDLTTDSDAGAYVTSYSVNTDNASVGSVSFTLTGTGPITFV